MKRVKSRPHTPAVPRNLCVLVRRLDALPHRHKEKEGGFRAKMSEERWTTFEEFMDWSEGKTKTLNIYGKRKKRERKAK